VFLRRIYTSKEREYCEKFKNKYERYAGGLRQKKRDEGARNGLAAGVRWVDLEVVREASGRPTLELGGEAGNSEAAWRENIALSITHIGGSGAGAGDFES